MSDVIRITAVAGSISMTATVQTTLALRLPVKTGESQKARVKAAD